MTPERSLARIAGPAARLKMTPEEYLAKKAAGMKWCWKCQAWQPIDDFHFSSSSPDGRHAVCKVKTLEAATQRMRARGVPARVRP